MRYLKICYLINKTSHKLESIEALLRKDPKNAVLQANVEDTADVLDCLFIDKLNITVTNRCITRIIQNAPASGRIKDCAIEKLSEKCLKKLAKANSFDSVMRICKKQQEIGCVRVQTLICKKALKFARCYDEYVQIIRICPDGPVRNKARVQAIDDAANSAQISFICKNTTKLKWLFDYALQKWIILSTAEYDEIKTSQQAQKALQDAPDESDIKYEISYLHYNLLIQEGKLSAQNYRFMDFD